MKKVSLFFFVFAFLSLSSQRDSASRRIVHNACLAVNLGATSPVPLPATVRKINSWNPGLNLSVGYEGLYRLRKKWRFGFGLKLDFKGMTVNNQVLYMRTQITVQSGSSSGSFEGYFSGRNETKVKNTYFTMPVYIAYKPAKTWRLKLGAYVGFLFHSQFTGRVYDGYIRNGSPIGEKISVNEAAFDLSRKQKRWDYGILAGTQHSINSSISVIANINWGLSPVLEAGDGVDFNVYNIFLNLGLAYRL